MLSMSFAVVLLAAAGAAAPFASPFAAAGAAAEGAAAADLAARLRQLEVLHRCILVPGSCKLSLPAACSGQESTDGPANVQSCDHSQFLSG